MHAYLHVQKTNLHFVTLAAQKFLMLPYTCYLFKRKVSVYVLKNLRSKLQYRQMKTIICAGFTYSASASAGGPEKRSASHR